MGSAYVLVAVMEGGVEVLEPRKVEQNRARVRRVPVAVITTTGEAVS